jgi:hypothetical protein
MTKYYCHSEKRWVSVQVGRPAPKPAHSREPTGCTQATAARRNAAAAAVQGRQDDITSENLELSWHEPTTQHVDVMIAVKWTVGRLAAP